MTTFQLIIVCLTVLALAVVAARVVWLLRKLEVESATNAARLDAASRVTREREALLPEAGASVAVHFDGRVVQGTVAEACPSSLLLDDASVVSDGKFNKLGGRQYIPAPWTQIQELT